MTFRLYEVTGLIRSFFLALAFACVAHSSAEARDFIDDGGMALIWVTINAHSGEGPWQACRRLYQRDVYQVAGGSGNKVRCRIDSSRIYLPGQSKQNFNNN